VLGPSDDISRFDYIQKHDKETGPALVDIELQARKDYENLLEKMEEYNINFLELNKDDDLFGYLV
jgi:threonine dehydratase